MLLTWRNLQLVTLRIYSRCIESSFSCLWCPTLLIMCQCCIPCFKGLLPTPHNDSVVKLLFLASYWHSLVKLCLHSETTLKVLDNVTVLFARVLCHFKEVTCPCFNMVETDCEYNARCWGAERRMSHLQANTEQLPGASSKCHKTFNLLISKLHTLRDYVETIRVFGTTDSYSTQIVHFKGVLSLWKGTDVTVTTWQTRAPKHQNTVHTYKQTMLYWPDGEQGCSWKCPGEDEQWDCCCNSCIDQWFQKLGQGTAKSATMSPPVNPHVDFLASGHWCCIAWDQSKKVYLPQFLSDPQNAADPAFTASTSCSVWSYSDANQSSHKNFYNNLLCHLLAHHLSQVSVSDELEYTSSKLEHVKIQYNTIFSHATATIHYMAYDITQDLDLINCNSPQCDVMLRVCDDTHHPFWYVWILGIYYANCYFGPNSSIQPDCMEFLFVQWFGWDPDWQGGPGTCRLDQIGWVPEDDPSGTFGFLNLACVIWAYHLIPAFSYGQTKCLLSPFQEWEFSTGDWTNYYVSRYVNKPDSLVYLLTYKLRFVDRDMMMQYLGWGIGHHNPPDFAHEANLLITSSSDRELKQYKTPSDKTQPAEAEENELEGGENSEMGDLDSDPEIIQEVVTYEY